MSLYHKMIDLQKLHHAWSQVYKNRPAEGVDSVTCEEFEADKKNQIKQLWKELTENTYECLPVRQIPLYKGDKIRYISLYAMRDKIIQHSVAKELSVLYEPTLSQCCYAYRSGRSASRAAQVIEKQVVQMQTGYVLRTDIRSFFDSIVHEKLAGILKEKIRDQSVLDLILKIIRAPVAEKDGTLLEKTRGLHQGAAIAPVLSNIYMMKLDTRIEQEAEFYVRYSDDLLILFSQQEETEKYKEKLVVYLEELGLELNQDKTKLSSIQEEFEFLGYAFHEKGMSTPEKAEIQLAERLEKVWLDSSCKTIQERLKKGAEILEGWEQYYPGKRQVHSILEYVVRLYRGKRNGKLNIDSAKELRIGLENPYKDVAAYLAAFWREHSLDEYELLEYEQYYCLHQMDQGKKQRKKQYVRNFFPCTGNFLLMRMKRTEQN